MTLPIPLEAKEGFAVPAEVHSDDRIIEVEFDASEWLAQASEQEIMDLAECGWGGEEAADVVAEYFQKKNPDIDKLFDYLHLVKDKKNAPGFECHVDEDEAIYWLVNKRPAIGLKLASVPDSAVIAFLGQHLQMGIDFLAEPPEKQDEWRNLYKTFLYDDSPEGNWCKFFNDQEVLGLDPAGQVLIQWNAEQGAAYTSGESLESFGVDNLTAAERKRVGLPVAPAVTPGMSPS